ncbi:MAG: alkaline phosphatase family protein [Actinomycetota bacterium]
MSTTRRAFLRVAGAGAAGVVLSGSPATAFGARRRPAERTRVYVLVIDGCRPDEVSSGLTPRLAALRADGTTFPAARSLPVAETIPNHVMMMTGARPDRTGVPANAVYDRAEGRVRTLDRPSDLRFPTVLERLRDNGMTTGTVLSKDYLFGVFGERATYRWEPFPLLPLTDHAPDAATVDALVAMVDAADPDLVFTNLGDIDRFGHSDLSGTTLRAARQAALADTDRQVGRFVDHLVATGRWSSSVLVVLADHSMDWSLPTNVISVGLLLASRPDLADNVAVSQNGGADLLTWTGPAAEREAGLSDVRALLLGHPGVLSVRTPGELRLGPEAGDLVAYCRAGWRFSDPYVASNPIPGNHGHPATEPIPFFVAGGSPRVRHGATASVPATTVDVAPTVGYLLGLGEPDGGYDGVVLVDALTEVRRTEAHR